MTDYQEYLAFLYTTLASHNKKNLVLSEDTALVADIGLSSLEVMEFIEKIEDGASVPSSDFSKLGGASSPRTLSAGMRVHDFEVYAASAKLEDASTGLGDDWEAVHASLDEQRNWFPDAVPVLLAQLDGGEGRTKDSGLRIDSDRVLVRIVGYGGRP